MTNPIMREKSINFLDVTPSTTPTWALMNKGIESASVSYNANVTTRQFIADSTASSDVTGFAKQLDVTQWAYKGDATFDFIDDLFFNDAKGVNAYTDMLQVFTYRMETESLTGIPAKLQPVTIQLDSHGGDGGDQLQLGYNILFRGDAIIGTVDIVAGVPTFTATV